MDGIKYHSHAWSRFEARSFQTALPIIDPYYESSQNSLGWFDMLLILLRHSSYQNMFGTILDNVTGEAEEPQFDATVLSPTSRKPSLSLF
jgi:hypothetical protein